MCHLCRKVYGTCQIASRGWGFLRRYPLSQMPRKVIPAISTDLGYRYTYGYRGDKESPTLCATSR